MNKKFLIFVLGLFNALTPFSIDMYLASFPNIAQDLGVTVSQVALSISAYFLGFAGGQILYGPLFDRFGRKNPLYIGLGIYIVATVGCMLATSIESLLVFRFLSAIGGSAAGVAATTMVRDFFEPSETTKVFSLLMLVLSASPLLAPTIGSWIVLVASWRVIFAILAVMALIDILLLKFFIPNTYERDPSFELKLKPLIANFKSILNEPQFLVYTLAGSFSFAGLFVYIAGSPAIFMDGFGLSPQEFGGVFAVLVGGLIGGGQLNLLFIKKYGERRIFKTMLILEVVFAAIFLVGSLAGWYGLVATIAMIFVILFCVGVTYPNAAALALTPFRKNIGSAAALLGFLQLSAGALASAGVGFLNLKGSQPTAVAIFVSSGLGLWILIKKEKRLPALSEPRSL